MNIFFDLDGTLIDSRNRLYQLFQKMVPQSRLSFDEYWNLKRSKVGHDRILKEYFSYNSEQRLAFEEKWLTKIEEPVWLAYDMPFQGVTEFLINVKERHHLFVVTARQYPDRAVDQIKEFRWFGLFDNILVTKHKVEKSDLISNSVLVNSLDWIVGDTGKDIESGKKLGIKTAAVLSGFLNAESLMPYHPDVIANSVVDIKFL